MSLYLKSQYIHLTTEFNIKNQYPMQHEAIEVYHPIMIPVTTSASTKEASTYPTSQQLQRKIHNLGNAHPYEHTDTSNSTTQGLYASSNGVECGGRGRRIYGRLGSFVASLVPLFYVTCNSGWWVDYNEDSCCYIVCSGGIRYYVCGKTKLLWEEGNWVKSQKVWYLLLEKTGDCKLIFTLGDCNSKFA